MKLIMLRADAQHFSNRTPHSGARGPRSAAFAQRVRAVGDPA
jgi:hypothetical protein